MFELVYSKTPGFSLCFEYKCYYLYWFVHLPRFFLRETLFELNIELPSFALYYPWAVQHAMFLWNLIPKGDRKLSAYGILTKQCPQWILLLNNPMYNMYLVKLIYTACFFLLYYCYFSLSTMAHYEPLFKE